MVLVENKQILLRDFEILKPFNNYIVSITDELPVFNWVTNCPEKAILANKVNLFNNHPSIKVIKKE